MSEEMTTLREYHDALAAFNWSYHKVSDDDEYERLDKLRRHLDGLRRNGQGWVALYEAWASTKHGGMAPRFEDYEEPADPDRSYEPGQKVRMIMDPKHWNEALCPRPRKGLTGTIGTPELGDRLPPGHHIVHFNPKPLGYEGSTTVPLKVPGYCIDLA